MTRRRRWSIVAGVGGALGIAALATAGALAGGDSTPPGASGSAGPPVAADEPRNRHVTVPPREPGEPTQPGIETALQSVADQLAAGRYTRAMALQMRCNLEQGQVAINRYTPPVTVAYYRRMIRLIESVFADLDVARECATPAAVPRRRIPLPPPLDGEPPLDDAAATMLASLHDQLERGQIARAQAVDLICGIYRNRDELRRDGRYPPVARAVHRRYEALLRAYYPDLDAAECPRDP